MNFLANFFLLRQLIVRIDYLWPLSTALPSTYLLLTTRRIEVLSFVIENKAHQSRVHLVSES
jgi:hypothetical protein